MAALFGFGRKQTPADTFQCMDDDSYVSGVSAEEAPFRRPEPMKDLMEASSAKQKTRKLRFGALGRSISNQRQSSSGTSKTTNNDVPTESHLPTQPDGRPQLLAAPSDPDLMEGMDGEPVKSAQFTIPTLQRPFKGRQSSDASAKTVPASFGSSTLAPPSMHVTDWEETENTSSSDLDADAPEDFAEPNTAPSRRGVLAAPSQDNLKEMRLASARGLTSLPSTEEKAEDHTDEAKQDPQARRRSRRHLGGEGDAPGEDSTAGEQVKRRSRRHLGEDGERSSRRQLNDETGSSRTSTRRSSLGPVNSRQSSSGQLGSRQSSTGQLGARQSSMGQMGARQSSTGQMGLSKARRRNSVGATPSSPTKRNDLVDGASAEPSQRRSSNNGGTVNRRDDTADGAVSEVMANQRRSSNDGGTSQRRHESVEQVLLKRLNSTGDGIGQGRSESSDAIVPEHKKMQRRSSSGGGTSHRRNSGDAPQSVIRRGSGGEGATASATAHTRIPSGDSGTPRRRGSIGDSSVYRRSSSGEGASPTQGTVHRRSSSGESGAAQGTAHRRGSSGEDAPTLSQQVSRRNLADGSSESPSARPVGGSTRSSRTFSRATLASTGGSTRTVRTIPSFALSVELDPNGETKSINMDIIEPSTPEQSSRGIRSSSSRLLGLDTPEREHKLALNLSEDMPKSVSRSSRSVMGEDDLESAIAFEKQQRATKDPSTLTPGQPDRRTRRSSFTGSGFAGPSQMRKQSSSPQVTRRLTLAAVAADNSIDRVMKMLEDISPGKETASDHPNHSDGTTPSAVDVKVKVDEIDLLEDNDTDLPVDMSRIGVTAGVSRTEQMRSEINREILARRKKGPKTRRQSMQRKSSVTSRSASSVFGDDAGPKSPRPEGSKSNRRGSMKSGDAHDNSVEREGSKSNRRGSMKSGDVHDNSGEREGSKPNRRGSMKSGDAQDNSGERDGSKSNRRGSAKCGDAQDNSGERDGSKSNRRGSAKSGDAQDNSGERDGSKSNRRGSMKSGDKLDNGGERDGSRSNRRGSMKSGDGMEKTQSEIDTNESKGKQSDMVRQGSKRAVPKSLAEHVERQAIARASGGHTVGTAAQLSIPSKEGDDGSLNVRFKDIASVYSNGETPTRV